MLCSGGYHRVERTWKDKDHMTSEAWFGTAGEPVKAEGNAFVRRELDYDEQGNVTAERLFDADGNEIRAEE